MLTKLRFAPVAAFLLFLAVFPYLKTWPVFDTFLNPFRTFQGAQFGVWLRILPGLNLLTGYSGQISLGHGAFVAFGAYAAAIMMTRFGVPLVVAVPAAGIVTGAVGFALGVPALRLTGPYLAIATLAMMVAFPQILKLNGITEWTGGNHGIWHRGVDRPRGQDTLRHTVRPSRVPVAEGEVPRKLAGRGAQEVRRAV